MWGFVGPPPEETKDASAGHIWTHKSFDIDYNENRVRRRSTPPAEDQTSIYRLAVFLLRVEQSWASDSGTGSCSQIIQVNLTSENPQPIASGARLDFTFSVRWTPSKIAFTRRFERYLDYNFFEHQVRKLCCQLVMFLRSQPSVRQSPVHIAANEAASDAGMTWESVVCFLSSRTPSSRIAKYI